MRGVDRVDLSNYPTWKELCMCYAFVLDTKKTDALTTLNKYHSEAFSAKGGQPSNIPNPMRLTGRHFIKTMP